MRGTSRSIDADSSGFEHAAYVADLDGDGTLELYVAADDQHELAALHVRQGRQVHARGDRHDRPVDAHLQHQRRDDLAAPTRSSVRHRAAPRRGFTSSELRSNVTTKPAPAREVESVRRLAIRLQLAGHRNEPLDPRARPIARPRRRRRLEAAGAPPFSSMSSATEPSASAPMRPSSSPTTRSSCGRADRERQPIRSDRARAPS